MNIAILNCLNVAMQRIPNKREVLVQAAKYFALGVAVGIPMSMATLALESVDSRTIQDALQRTGLTQRMGLSSQLDASSAVVSDAEKVLDELRADLPPGDERTEVRSALRYAWFDAMVADHLRKMVGRRGESLSADNQAWSDAAAQRLEQTLRTIPPALVQGWEPETQKAFGRASAQLLYGSGASIDKARVLTTDLEVMLRAIKKFDAQKSFEINASALVRRERQI